MKTICQNLKESQMMTKYTFSRSLATIAVLTLISAAAIAGDKPADTAAVPLSKHQTVCPVMGGKIDSAEYTDIQGQRIYHCCGGCQKKLVADPEKYFKKTAAQGVLFENIQKRCPVNGETLTEKKLFTDYDGRRIYLAGDSCLVAFQKDPAKYLKILSQQTKQDSPDKPAKKSGHEGHMNGM
jgi:YHS domain-containing protein